MSLKPAIQAIEWQMKYLHDWDACPLSCLDVRNMIRYIRELESKIPEGSTDGQEV